MAMFEQLNDQLLKIKFDPSFDRSRLEFCYIIRNHGPKNPPRGCDLGLKFPPHVGRSAKKIDSSSVQISLTYLYTLWRTIVSASARVSFSPGQRNLIKTLEIEGPIIRWSQNWDSIFAWELLNNQKYLSKSAKIIFFFSFRNIKGTDCFVI